MSYIASRPKIWCGIGVFKFCGRPYSDGTYDQCCKCRAKELQQQQREWLERQERRKKREMVQKCETKLRLLTMGALFVGIILIASTLPFPSAFKDFCPNSVIDCSGSLADDDQLLHQKCMVVVNASMSKPCATTADFATTATAAKLLQTAARRRTIALPERPA